MCRERRLTTSSTPWKAAKSGIAEIKRSFRFLKALILAPVNYTWAAFLRGDPDPDQWSKICRDQAASKEPVNPLWSWIRRFLWCTMIQTDLGSLIRIRISPKERSLGFSLVNNIVRNTVVWRRIFISITCFGIPHPKSPPVSFQNKLVFRFAVQQKHVLLCWESDGRNPKLSSACSSLGEETLKFP